MAQLRAGDGDAADCIFQRYAHGLIGLAHSRLGPLIRRKSEPEDVVQSVFRSFFRRQGKANWDLENWDSLWRLLTTITLCKCGHRIDYFRAARRDIQREADESVLAWEAIAREPTPAEAALLTDTVEELMRSLEERERRILAYSLQGEPVAHIAGQLGCSQRTVERGLKRIRKRLERMREQDQ
jgi:RNA polymerase sigma-70 factor (ECF subfamily)